MLKGSRLQLNKGKNTLANTFSLLCCCNLQCCDSAETQTGFISLLISQSFWPAGETAVTAAGGVGVWGCVWGGACQSCIKINTANQDFTEKQDDYCSCQWFYCFG